jgi:hypothetical protein
MTYSRRQLYALGEPLGESVTRKEAGRTIYGFGGGPSASAPSSQSVANTNIPDYFAPQAQQMIGQAAQLTMGPNAGVYQGTAAPVADFSALQNQAFQNVGNMQPNAALNAGVTAAQNMQGKSFTDEGVASRYMNPYLQNALAPAQQLLNQQYGIAGQQQQGAATQAGAFGGSRSALANALNQQNQMLAQNQLVGNAYNTAYNQGAQQYNAEQGQQQQLASLLGQLGQTQYSQQMGINAAQQQAGAQQQSLDQQKQNAQYALQQQQLNFPYQQLQYMSGLLHGLPGTATTTSMYQAPPTTANTLMAAGLGAYGLSKMAEGGTVGEKPVQKFAAGGMPMTGRGSQLAMSPEAQYQLALKSPTRELQRSIANQGPFTPAIGAQVANERDHMETAAKGLEAQAQLAQAARLPEHLGIAMAPGAQQMGDIPEGGVVGMASGGSVRHFDGSDGSYLDPMGGVAYAPSQGLSPETRGPYGPLTNILRNMFSRPKTEYELRQLAAAANPTRQSRPANASMADWGLQGKDSYFPGTPGRSNGIGDDPASRAEAARAAAAGNSNPAKPAAPTAPAAAAPTALADNYGSDLAAAAYGAAARAGENAAPAAAPAPTGLVGLPTAQDYIDRTKSLAAALGAGSRPEQEALSAELAAQRERILADQKNRQESMRGLAALTAAGELLKPGRQGLASIGAALQSVVPHAQEAKKEEARIQDRLDAAALSEKQMQLSNRRGDMDAALKASGHMQEQINQASKIIYDQAYHQEENRLRALGLDEETRKNRAAEAARVEQNRFTAKYYEDIVAGHTAQFGLDARKLALLESRNPAEIAKLEAEAYYARHRFDVTPAVRQRAQASVTKQWADKAEQARLRRQPEYKGRSDQYIQDDLYNRAINAIGGGESGIGQPASRLTNEPPAGGRELRID